MVSSCFCYLEFFFGSPTIFFLTSKVVGNGTKLALLDGPMQTSFFEDIYEHFKYYVDNDLELLSGWYDYIGGSRNTNSSFIAKDIRLTSHLQHCGGPRGPQIYSGR